MSTFNLIDEPWIPVLDAEADLRADPRRPVTRREVGLREAFARAHEIREVYTDAPLETIALNRLLLALFIDVFSPEPDEEEWIALWRQGWLDREILEHYFTQWRDRFDLLDVERPYYQHPKPLAKGPAPLSKLFHAEASGNNATLFGHEMDETPRRLSLAEAARGIVSAQAAALGGGVSKPFNFSHAPLVGGAVFWLRGRSLFDALLLNAPPFDEARMWDEDEPDESSDDRPTWRAERLAVEHERRRIKGYLDYLTWQARRLMLVTETSEEGECVATGVYLTQGDKDEPAVTEDPLMARRISKKVGLYRFGFQKERALWRDANLILKLGRRNDEGSPLTFQWLRYMADEPYPGDAETLQTLAWEADVFGLVNDQAKVELWRHERMPVYLSYLTEEQRLNLLGRALDFAEKQAGVLKGAVRTVAEYLLAPPPAGSDQAPKADSKAVANLVNSLEAGVRYWAVLEPEFYRLLGDLAADPDETARQNRFWEWAEDIYHAAAGTFEDATRMLDQDARQLRAVAKGRRRLGRIKEYRDHLKHIQEETMP